MNIPPDAEISFDKLTRYLLVPRPWDDKSKFLAKAGFDQSNPDVLLKAIRDQAAAKEAVPNGKNEYGTFYRVEDGLKGPNGTVLQTISVWIQWHHDATVHFVTLKPLKKGQA